MPRLGLGTWLLYGDEATEGVQDALEMGYRHIDTARAYENEMRLGIGIEESGVPRDEIFLTSKIFLIPESERQFNLAVLTWEVEESLEKLRTDYLDLLLLHWPNPNRPLEQVLTAMVQLKEDGLIRQLGVSNFPAKMLEEALELAPIFCDQVEFHPFLLPQTRLVSLATERDILLTAHTPLAGGHALEDATLKRIGVGHGKTAAQVAIRWLLDQPQVCVIPMAPRHEWRLENLEALDFELSDLERAEIDRLPKDMRTVAPAWGPDWEG